MDYDPKFKFDVQAELEASGVSIDVSAREVRSGGKLADVAPTVIAILGLQKPGAMTGESLLEGQPGA